MDKYSPPVTLVETWIALVHGKYGHIVKSSNLSKVISHFGSLKQAEAYVALNSELPKQSSLIIEQKKPRIFRTQLKLKRKEHYSL